MSLFKKFFNTLRAFYDFRVLLLLAMGLSAVFVVDPAATVGLCGYLAWVIGMWGAALLLSKLLMPYISLSELARSALHEGNNAAALVILARVLLMAIIAVSLILWGK